MKQKGDELPPPGVRHHETTRDERLKVTTLRDKTGMNWTETDKRLNIRKSTVQKVEIDLI